jgi:deoxyribodipyrimidine photo-lyase
VRFFGFRNDLRLQDNLGLDYILQQDLPPIFIYIFDETKSESEKLGSASKYWLHHSLKNLQKKSCSIGLSPCYS